MSKSNAKAAAARLKQQQLNDSKQGTSQQPEKETKSPATDDGTKSVDESTQEQVASPDSAAATGTASDSVNETEQPTEQGAQEPASSSDAKDGTESKDKTEPAKENLSPKKADNELVRVEFVGPYKRYSRGDIAAFSEDIAQGLVKKGAAVWPGERKETEKEPV
ncbi:MAG: hypothetical protein MJK10_03830 [Pseudomonadales bacterium]|nr:hypothetical protein [Pseudomonadales bacterium]NRA15201.1 hypothetical protein [Oceanospirillaceae bacterium]